MNYSRLLNKVYMQKDFLDQFRNEKVQKIFVRCLDTRGKFTELSSTIIEEDKGGLEVVLGGGQLNIISEGLGKFFFFGRFALDRSTPQNNKHCIWHKIVF